MDSEQRKTFRILVPEGNERGVLRHGRRMVQVRVVDSSAGGFALACRKPLPVMRGDALQLRTNTGWHEVRVARQETYTDGCLLGVERIADIDDPRELEQVNGTNRMGVLTVAAVIGILVIGGVALLASHQAPKRNTQILREADQVVSDLASQARKLAGSAQNEPAAAPAP